MIDPLFLLCFVPRPVSFLAKAPLFRMPLIGWFARGIDSIPVYRTQDNYSTSQNREMFARGARAARARRRDRAFSRGDDAQRAAAERAEDRRGAHRARMQRRGVSGHRHRADGGFLHGKHSFRSDAMLYFGDGIDVVRTTVDENGEPPRDAVAALTDRVESALTALTLQADSREALDLIGRAERIMSLGRAALPEQLEMRRRWRARIAADAAARAEQRRRAQSR